MWACHVLPAPWSDRPLASISRVEARAWWTELHEKASSNPNHRGRLSPLKAGTLSNILTLVRRSFGDALDDGLLLSNPFAGLRVHRARRASTTVASDRVLTLEEQQAALAALPDAERLIARVALGTGMRMGEQWALRLVDVDLTSPQPSIRIRFGRPLSRPCKGGRGRRIPLFGDALAAMRQWLAALSAYAPSNPHALVFPRVSGQPRGRGKPFRPVDRIATAIGRGFTWHNWRHSAATSLAGGWWGGDPWTVEAICVFLGHRSTTTTEVYARLADELSFRSAVRMPGVHPSQEGAVMTMTMTKKEASAPAIRDNCTDHRPTHGSVADSELDAQAAAARRGQDAIDTLPEVAAEAEEDDAIAVVLRLGTQIAAAFGDCPRRQAGTDERCLSRARHEGPCSWEPANKDHRRDHLRELELDNLSLISRIAELESDERRAAMVSTATRQIAELEKAHEGAFAAGELFALEQAIANLHGRWNDAAHVLEMLADDKRGSLRAIRGTNKEGGGDDNGRGTSNVGGGDARQDAMRSTGGVLREVARGDGQAVAVVDDRAHRGVGRSPDRDRAPEPQRRESQEEEAEAVIPSAPKDRDVFPFGARPPVRPVDSRAVAEAERVVLGARAAMGARCRRSWQTSEGLTSCELNEQHGGPCESWGTVPLSPLLDDVAQERDELRVALEGAKQVIEDLRSQHAAAATQVRAGDVTAADRGVSAAAHASLIARSLFPAVGRVQREAIERELAKFFATHRLGSVNELSVRYRAAIGVVADVQKLHAAVERVLTAYVAGGGK